MMMKSINGELLHDRIVGAILAAFVVILPLLIIPTGYDPFRFPKTLVMRAGGILLLSTYAIGAVWGARPVGWRDLLSDWLGLIGVAIVTWVAIAALLSPEPEVSWWAWVDVLLGLTIFFSARDYLRRTNASWLLYLLLLPALINVVLLVLQDRDLWHPIVTLSEFRDLPFSERLILSKAALLGNRDDVGMYVCIALTVALGLSLSTSGWKRWFAGLSAGVLGLGLVTAETITALVAAAIVVWLFTALVLLRAGCGAKTRIVVLALIPVLAVFFFPEQSKRRLEVYSRHVVQNAYFELASGSRFSAFASAFRVVKENPLTGVGPGRYPVTSVEAVTKLRMEDPVLFPRNSPTWFDMVHNDYLEIAVEAGVPALVVSMGFLVSYVAGAFKIAERREPYLFMAVSFAAVLLVTSLLLFPLQIAVVYGTLAVAAGGVIGRLHGGVS